MGLVLTRKEKQKQKQKVFSTTSEFKCNPKTRFSGANFAARDK